MTAIIKSGFKISINSPEKVGFSSFELDHHSQPVAPAPAAAAITGMNKAS